MPVRISLRALLLAAALMVYAGLAAAQAAPAPPDSAAVSEPFSARGAFLRSLVLPGWGQSYVGSPGRGAVYFALEAGSLWMVYKTSRELGEVRELQRYLRATGRLSEQQTLGIVEAREEQREDWITLSLFLLLFSGADAYVAAQLADFDERIGVRPGPEGGVRLEARVPVGRR